MEQDALDLIDLVSDQVRRLGAHSRTKKAITIFGHVGRQSHVSRFSGIGVDLKLETRSARTPRTLFRLLLESILSFLESAISSLMIWSFALVHWTWKTASAHKILLVLLTLSALLNGFYSVRDTYEWWQERNAGRFVARLGVQPNHVMSKAIYLKDIDEAIANSTVWHSRDNVTDCYLTFQDEVSQDTSVQLSVGAAGTQDNLARSALRRLQQTRERLAMYRHDLLVALRVVNSIEKEVIRNEWESWLGREIRRCRQIEPLLQSGHGQHDMDNANVRAGEMARGVFADHTEEVKKWYETYCRSCREEHEHVEKTRLDHSSVF